MKNAFSRAHTRPPHTPPECENAPGGRGYGEMGREDNLERRATSDVGACGE
jgi:hypothetical protein